jgi:hypothetical protein
MLSLSFKLTRNEIVCLCFNICLCIFILPAGTLRLPSLRFFCVLSSVVRQVPGYKSQRRGTARTLPKTFCVVLSTVCFVSFRVPFVCKCVLYYSHWVANQLRFNKYIISKYKICTSRFLVIWRRMSAPKTARPCLTKDTSSKTICNHYPHMNVSFNGYSTHFIVQCG